MRSVLGHKHQGCQDFAPFNGVQCTPIAFAFLLLLENNQLSLADISTQDIDNILYTGTTLYAELVSLNNVKGYLGHDHMPWRVSGFPQTIFTHRLFSWKNRYNTAKKLWTTFPQQWSPTGSQYFQLHPADCRPTYSSCIHKALSWTILHF